VKTSFSAELFVSACPNPTPVCRHLQFLVFFQRGERVLAQIFGAWVVAEQLLSLSLSLLLVNCFCSFHHHRCRHCSRLIAVIVHIMVVFIVVGWLFLFLPSWLVVVAIVVNVLLVIVIFVVIVG
jgi:hypothetical protein